MINILLANQTIREFLGMEEGQTFMEYTGDMVVSILIVGLGLSLTLVVVWLMQFLSVKLINKFNNPKMAKHLMIILTNSTKNNEKKETR